MGFAIGLNIALKSSEPLILYTVPSGTMSVFKVFLTGLSLVALEISTLQILRASFKLMDQWQDLKVR